MQIFRKSFIELGRYINPKKNFSYPIFSMEEMKDISYQIMKGFPISSDGESFLLYNNKISSFDTDFSERSIRQIRSGYIIPFVLDEFLNINVDAWE